MRASPRASMPCVLIPRDTETQSHRRMPGDHGPSFVQCSCKAKRSKGHWGPQKLEEARKDSPLEPWVQGGGALPTSLLMDFRSPD